MPRNLTLADKSVMEQAASRLTTMQRAFVDNLFTPGLTQEEAAVKAGYSPRSAHVIASRTLRLPHVVDYIDACVNRGVKVFAAGALGVVKKLSESAKSPYVQLQAAQDLLDRAGHKPVEKSMVAVQGELRVNIDLS
jgi:phage terminase small subunit